MMTQDGARAVIINWVIADHDDQSNLDETIDISVSSAS